MQGKKNDNATINKRGLQIIAGSLLIFLFAFLVLLRLDGSESRRRKAIDPLDNPLYSKYVFEKNENIIHFGYQPLRLFSANIAEIMIRDVTLKERLKEIGMEVKFYPFLSGEDLNFFVLRNDLQGGMSSDAATLMIASTLSVVAPALTEQAFHAIVSRSFKSISDMKGKRIAYPSGSSAHYALLAALRLYDMSENDVKLLPMEIADLVLNMKHNKIEACALWEPLTSQLLTEVPGAVVIHRSVCLGFVYFRKDFVENHRDAMMEIIASEARAIKWMLMNRVHLTQSCQWIIDRSTQLSADLSPLNAENIADIVLKNSSANFMPLIPYEALGEKGHLIREYDFLYSVNKISDSSPWSKVRYMFTNEYIRQILDYPARYQLKDLRFAKPDNG